ncbi:MAG: GDP-mannose dehydrogenase, partial [Pseudomonadota bacterium]|nr:GDP-mannose dehydrogenase [Pseudomonadota bacterium]
LVGKGYDVKIFDRNVNIARLVGANRDYILNHIPHISKLMVESIEAVLTHAQTVVVGNADKDFAAVPDRLRADQVLVDLVRVSPGRSEAGKYDGICW